MRLFLSLLLVVCVLGVVGLAAQEHQNATEKKASDEITISDPVKIGGKMLPAGRYRISCDRETVTFEALSRKREKTTFPCRGKQLPAKAGATELRLNVAGGERTVSALLLQGSGIEHTF